MANIASVAKRARQSLKRRAHNSALRSSLRTERKKMQKYFDKNEMEAVVSNASATIRLFDKMAAKGIIHKNKAARCKSRLIAKIRKSVPDFVLTSTKKVAAPAAEA
jgi:small subunit ribosomal protein S20